MERIKHTSVFAAVTGLWFWFFSFETFPCSPAQPPLPSPTLVSQLLIVEQRLLVLP